MSDRTGGEGIIGSNFFFKMIRPQQHEVSITSAALNGFLVKKKKQAVEVCRGRVK